MAKATSYVRKPTDKNKRRVVIPSHPGKDIKPSLVRVIIKEIGISRGEFLRLLEKV
ncbi:MAG TPA: addiction module toxin, HicA family [Candidatus Aenigmarchaeota archaeon]|nr:addiction module toxin, HicA family [Candidatus Aenigmarchaeota archaeon]